MSHEEIALGLGISRNTLEKHFERELSIGAYEKRLEVLDATQRSAKRGNVAAQKFYLSLSPAPAAPPAQLKDQGTPAGDVAPDKQPKLGKKDQANADAKTAQADTPWADLLPGQAPTIQ